MRNYEQIFEIDSYRFCIDTESFSAFKQAFEQDEKLRRKFRDRAEAIGRGLSNREIYEKLSGFNTLWEIKLFKRSKGRNYRFYCKQIESGDQIVYIILVELFQKKSQKIPKEIRKKLKKVDNYEYNIQ